MERKIPQLLTPGPHGVVSRSEFQLSGAVFSRSEGAAGVSDAMRLETMVKTGFAEGDPFFALSLHAEFLLTSQGLGVCVQKAGSAYRSL